MQRGKATAQAYIAHTLMETFFAFKFFSGNKEIMKSPVKQLSSFSSGDERRAKYVHLCSPYHAVAGRSQRGPAVYLPLLSPLLTRLHLAIKIPVIIQLNLEYQVPPSHSICKPTKLRLRELCLSSPTGIRASREEMAPKPQAPLDNQSSLSQGPRQGSFLPSPVPAPWAIPCTYATLWGNEPNYRTHSLPRVPGD